MNNKRREKKKNLILISIGIESKNKKFEMIFRYRY